MNLSDAAILEISSLSFEAQQLARSGGAAGRKEAEVLLNRIQNIRQTGLSTDEMRGKYAHALNRHLNNHSTADERRYAEVLAKYLTCQYGSHETFEAELRTLGKNLEKRTEVDAEAGTQTISWTAGQPGGYVVPIDTEKTVWEAMAQTDPLLDPDVCDFVMAPGPTMQPHQISGYDLSSIAATQIGEATQQTPGAFPSVNGRVLRSNIIYKLTLGYTIEAADDIPSLLDKIARVAGVAFARKLGTDAVTGNGTTQPQGVYTAAYPSGITLGNASNGYANQGVGPIVNEDIAAAYFSLNRYYRAQPKCAWLMGDGVYEKIRIARDNMARPLLEVKDDQEMLYGKPVYVCPSMPGGGSPLVQGALVFGDLSAFHIRVTRPTLQRVSQASIADITQGKFAAIARIRMDSAYFDPSNGVAPPIVSAQVAA